MIRIHRLASGAYHVSWPGSDLPAGDGLLVDTSHAAAPWPDLADMLVHHRPVEGGGVGATLAVVVLGNGLCSVSCRAGQPVTVSLPCALPARHAYTH